MTASKPGPALRELLYYGAIDRWMPTCEIRMLRDYLEVLDRAPRPADVLDRPADERLWRWSPKGFNPAVLHPRLARRGVLSASALADRTALSLTTAERVWAGRGCHRQAHRVAVAQVLDGWSYGVDLRIPPPLPPTLSEARRAALEAARQERTTYVVVRALGELLGLPPSCTLLAYDTVGSEMGDELMAMSESEFRAYVRVQEREQFVGRPVPPDRYRDRARELLSELVAEFEELKAQADALRPGGQTS